MSKMSEKIPEEQEDKLWKEYKKTKDPKIREQLIIMYAPLVKYIAGRIAITTPPSVEFEDLVSYGILGLIDAIEKYDPKQGIRFKTYATTRIRGAILDELRILDWIPRSVRQKSKELERVYGELEVRLGRPATDEEVAEHMGISVEELHELLLQVSGAVLVSLDEERIVHPEEEEVTLSEAIEAPAEKQPDAILEREETKRMLVEAIQRLPQKEREVIALYYYEGLTLKEIGKVLGVTESRVSQLHTKTIMRLRGYLSRMKAFKR
jgi:RNA polymerase sigma factor for flagellar operon FliA